MEKVDKDINLFIINLSEKFSEAVENTLWEIIQYTKCNNFEEFKSKGYSIYDKTFSNNPLTKRRVIFLSKDNEPIFGYDIYITIIKGKEIKVVREPMTNVGIREFLEEQEKYNKIIGEENPYEQKSIAKK